ncbi:MAG: YihY/virulence factor BrkB family protein [Microbacteriaceae bacterium]
MTSKIAALVQRIQKLRPVRVFMRYLEQRGPLLAGGLSYQAIFATFAAIWVSFSIAGFVIQSNTELRDAIFGIISQAVPGLIDTGDGTGAVEKDRLLEAGILGWTGAIALVGLVFTALGWLASGRDAVRAMFKIGPQKANPILLKLKDLGLALVFGVALLLSAALSVFSTAALGTTLSFFSISQDSVPGIITTRTAGLFIVLLLDTVVLALFYRLVSGIAIPWRRLLGGSLMGAFALGLLKVLGSTLLGGASKNPLLASFAVIIGLLLWFNFICQVILIAAAWIAVGMDDRGIVADPAYEEVRRAEQLAQEERIRDQVIEEMTGGPTSWLARVFGRKKR